MLVGLMNLSLVCFNVPLSKYWGYEYGAVKYLLGGTANYHFVCLFPLASGSSSLITRIFWDNGILILFITIRVRRPENTKNLSRQQDNGILYTGSCLLICYFDNHDKV